MAEAYRRNVRIMIDCVTAIQNVRGIVFDLQNVKQIPIILRGDLLCAIDWTDNTDD